MLQLSKLLATAIMIVANCPVSCASDDQSTSLRCCSLLSLKSQCSHPYVGVIVHTVYTPFFAWHWNVYKKSVTYSQTHETPTLGFYDQNSGVSVEVSHYSQLRRAEADFALLSWYGGFSDPAIDGTLNSVLAAYWTEFSKLNASILRPRIRMAVLMEYADKNFRQRIDYLATEIYAKFPSEVLKYQEKPLLALGFGRNQPGVEAVVQYAQSEGFFVVNGNDASGGGSAFVGITMKADDPHRVTEMFAGVSPGVDISGKGHNFNVSELLTGCGELEPDSEASERIAVASTGVDCDVISSPPVLFDSQVPDENGDNSYAMLRIKAVNSTGAFGRFYVTDSSGHTYDTLFSPRNFPGTNMYTLFVLKLGRLDGFFSAHLKLTKGSVALDRMWFSAAQFRRRSRAEYDSQWETVERTPADRRPTFISVASLNAWEEGTQIEDNTFSGNRFLDSTAYWARKLRQACRRQAY